MTGTRLGESLLRRAGGGELEAVVRRRCVAARGPDIYVSKRTEHGSFGPPEPVSELNSPATDIQPSVRRDGREVVFASNRIAAAGQDLWVATRTTVDDPWSAPENLGCAVNTTA